MTTGCAFKRVEPQWQSQLERLVNNAQYSQFTVNYLGSQVADVGQARSMQAASARGRRCDGPRSLRSFDAPLSFLFPIGGIIGGRVDQLLSICPLTEIRIHNLHSIHSLLNLSQLWNTAYQTESSLPVPPVLPHPP